MFLHLGKDLDVNPVDWKGCKSPSTTPARQIETSYGIRKEVQEKLAAIRTDLDSFGEAEAFALMTSGYCMADREFPECVGKLMATNAGRVDWDFLRIRGLMVDPETGTQPDRMTVSETGTQADRDDLLWVLDVGSHQFFKYFYLHPRLLEALKLAWPRGVGLARAGLCLVGHPLLSIAHGRDGEWETGVSRWSSGSCSGSWAWAGWPWSTCSRCRPSSRWRGRRHRRLRLSGGLRALSRDSTPGTQRAERLPQGRDAAAPPSAGASSPSGSGPRPAAAAPTRPPAA